MRRHLLRTGVIAALLLTALHPVTASASATDTGAGVASSPTGPGTGTNPRDARVAASAATPKARSSALRAAGTGQAAVSWSSATIPIGGSEDWVWHNAPASAIFQVSLAPVDVVQHHSCTLRVTRTWYVKTTANERQFRFRLTNTAGQEQACRARILLNWTTPGTSWTSGTLKPGASTTVTWKHANGSKVYVAGLNPAGATTASCAIEITSTTYVSLNTGELQYRFTLQNVGSIACSTGIQLAWLGTQVRGVAEFADLQVLQPDTEGVVAWNKYPLSDNVVWVPGLNLTRLTPHGSCQVQLLSHEFSSFLYANGTSNGWLRVATKNTGADKCQPWMKLAPM